MNEWIATLDISESTLKRRARSFDINLFPFLGVERDENGVATSSPKMRDIVHPSIMEAINTKKKTANETARRLLTDCKALWNYAIAYGYVDANIIDVIPKNQKPRKKINHYPKITDEKILGNLLNDIRLLS